MTQIISMLKQPYPCILLNHCKKIHFKINKIAAIWLVLSGLLIACISQFSNIDLMLADYYFDAERNTFPWKETWFAKTLMHEYVKNGVIMFGILLIGITLFDMFFYVRRLPNSLRHRLRFVALASVLIPSVISGLKRFSVLHCPTDIDRYGGHAPFIKLFDHIPAQFQSGHCFPAGHASTALWLTAFCIFYLPHQPKKAFAVFCLGLAIGFALAWVQQMRGAHFLFHTLWSLWLTALIILVMLAFNPNLNQQ